MREHNDIHVPALTNGTPWTSLTTMPTRPDEFSFVLIPDRTGAARPGVFERAVEVTNLLRPDFAVQLGDTIAGYTDDEQVLAGMWDEFETIIGGLDVPLFRLPGNHDISNEMMRDFWLRRYSALHYHVRYRDVLFLMLDTQDPPVPLRELMSAPDAEARIPDEYAAIFARNGNRSDEETIAEFMAEAKRHPAGFQSLFRAIKDATQPGKLSEEQLEYFEKVIAEHNDVSWTFLCMHIPIWQGAGHRGLDRLREALGDRPYTAFAGHCHTYKHSPIDQRDHIRLGASGGAVLFDDPEGNFDHVSWVTMTRNGPTIANVVLDGVLGIEGGVFEARPRPLVFTVA